MIVKYSSYATWIAICIIALVIACIDRDSILINAKDMRQILSKEYIKSIEIDSDFAYLYGDRIYKLHTANLNEAISHIDNLPNITTRLSFVHKIIYTLLAAILGIAIIYIITKAKNNNPMQNTQQSIHTQDCNDEMSLSIMPMKSNAKLSDVAGIKSVKDDLIEIIDCLKNPYKYKNLGIYPPKGVLLIGPPGVGKTMIAKAIAGECNVPFFYQSGSSFVQLYVGVGAKRVRDLFNKARANAPAIIFIDEIDAIGKTRGSDNNHEWESTLNELLTQMDGFTPQSGILIIAATNREEVLDSALLRSGRFDRRIHVDLPDLAEREDILRVYLKDRRHEINLHEAARLCIGFSGANIASLINESAIHALRNNRDIITMQDILATSNEVLFGKKRQPTLSKEERRTMAIYNASKGIAKYWLLDDFDKISLLHSQGDLRLGEFNSKENLLSLIKISLSGNIGLVVNGLDESSIAMQDLKNAKYIAKAMCNDYGMGNKLISNNEDIIAILEEARISQREFIESHKDNIIKIADMLMDIEEINKTQLESILGNFA